MSDRRTEYLTGEKAAAPRTAAFPAGWYQVGFSDDVAPGKLKKARFFGRTLVLFRTVSGTVAMLDGICGHYAYPLARGAVKGECIECAMHGWLWSPEGKVARIPYFFSGGHQRRIRSWAPREVGNLIVVWYDPGGGMPTGAEPAELAGDGPVYSLSAPEPVTNRSPAQGSLLLNELRSGLPIWGPGVPDHADETSTVRTEVRIPHRDHGPLAWLRVRAASSAELETKTWGPGFHHARLKAGPLEVTELSATTPVSHELVQHFSTVRISAALDVQVGARTILGALTDHLDQSVG